MLFDETSIPENLRIQLSGLLSPGMMHNRVMRFEELYESLPKDASVRVGIYTSEIAPGGETSWHFRKALGLRTLLIDHFAQNGVS
jgi:hypothetical protein